MTLNLHNLHLCAVAAIGKRGEIGKNNQLIWKLSEDLKHFKQLTLHHGILMGRKTYESIGRPLPQRLNLVLSRDQIFASSVPEGVLVFSDLQEAIDTAVKKGLTDLFVIGGSQIYKELLPYCSRLFLTRIHAEEPDADAFFPDFNPRGWKEVSKQSFSARDGAPAFDIEELLRSFSISKNRQ